jgi:hypothetical protein
MNAFTKYELTDETIDYKGHTLHRIKAVTNFGDIKAGDLGGFIESEDNLSHSGYCWVYDEAKVYEHARVNNDAEIYGDADVYNEARVFDAAKIYGNAKVYGNAQIRGNAEVYETAVVYGSAKIYDCCWVYGNAVVISNEDYIEFKNWWSSGRHFTWTRSNNMWKVGCFYGTGEQLIEKAYKDSEKSGREYERVVKYVESILNK